MKQRTSRPARTIVIASVIAAGLLAGCSTPRTAPAPTTSFPVTPAQTQPAASPTAALPVATPPPATVPPATSPPPSTTPPTAAATTPTPAPTSETTVFPTTPYRPEAAPFEPTGQLAELFEYALSLINADRQKAHLSPVQLTHNAGAQKHAQDLFDNFNSSHWGSDGLKPYMRYTIEGGLNNEGENSAYSGWYNPGDDPTNYDSIDVRQDISILQYTMVYDDAGSNWGHRDTILNPSFTRVSLGIVYDEKRLGFVQQFEGDYVEFYEKPDITGDRLSLLGRLTGAGYEINTVSIAFDPLPEPLTNAQLTTDPAYTNGYGLGDRVTIILRPPPPGQTYRDLPPEAVVASKWEVNQAGQFAIEAPVSVALRAGKGVYTIVIVSLKGGEEVKLTNYSVFIR